ncbi:MAG: DUF3501 family protein [Alphaproteobacteria bacterium]|nr:DUF3501 family protein [Alphaproteobacteria bacterium]
MPRSARRITQADVLAMTEYGHVRAERQRALAATKVNRLVAVGPFATFHFESYDTMWLQVHEMLRIEGGGEAQIAGEIEAYNPLIPQGHELVATLMLEIDDRDRRERELARLGGVERTVSLALDGEVIAALPEGDVERTTPSGKTSALHFLRFPLTPAQVAKFRDPRCAAVLAIGHENYAHMTRLGPAVRAELGHDLD